MVVVGGVVVVVGGVVVVVLVVVGGTVVVVVVVVVVVAAVVVVTAATVTVDWLSLFVTEATVSVEFVGIGNPSGIVSAVATSPTGGETKATFCSVPAPGCAMAAISKFAVAPLAISAAQFTVRVCPTTLRPVKLAPMPPCDGAYESPAGRRLVTVQPATGPGPLFDTTTLMVTGSPTATEVGEIVWVFTRSYGRNPKSTLALNDAPFAIVVEIGAVSGSQKLPVGPPVTHAMPSESVNAVPPPDGVLLNPWSTPLATPVATTV